MAFPTGWTRYCPLVIQHGQVTANQTIAVVFTEACLPAEMLTTGNSHQAQADGGDIRFSTDTAGTSQLACEVVFWSKNANPALAKAEIWVPIAVSSSVDTTVYIWYSAGGSQSQPAAGAAFGRNAVWDSGYKGGVAHFPNGTSLTVFDSTGTNTFANTVTNPCSAVAGIVDGAVSSAANTTPAQSIDLGLLPHVFDGVSTVITLEAWAFPTDLSNDNRADGFCSSSRSGSNTLRVLVGKDGGTPSQIQIAVNQGSWVSNAVFFGSTVTTLVVNTWYHIVIVLDLVTPANRAVYVNGAVKASSSGTSGTPPTVIPTPLPSSANLFLQDGNERFAGSIDEYRMSNVIRSSTYVSTTYNNQHAPSSFTVAGSPVSPGGGGSAKGSALYGVNPTQGFIS